MAATRIPALVIPQQGLLQGLADLRIAGQLSEGLHCPHAHARVLVVQQGVDEGLANLD